MPPRPTHDAVRTFVHSLKPPLKLSAAGTGNLAVIAYKQPATARSWRFAVCRGGRTEDAARPQADRGGRRKNVIGKPILYKTTRNS